MNDKERLGLDELMIINPAVGGFGAMILGDDGRLYQLEGIAEESEGVGHLFLGEDGTLYQLSQSDSRADGDPASRAGGSIGSFFLGEGSALYRDVMGKEKPQAFAPG